MSAEELCSPRTRFCPACLAADEVGVLPPNATRKGRLEWVLRAVRTCPVHEIPLLDRRIESWKGDLRELPMIVPETHNELTELALRQPRRVVSPMQNYVLERLAGRSSSPWLDSMPLGAATAVTEKLGAILAFGTTALPRSLSDADWDFSGSTGWQYTDAGPEGVCEALSLVQRRAFEGGNVGLSKRDVFGMIHEWLTAKRNTKELAPIRKVFRGHYLATMELIPGSLLFGVPIEAPQFRTPATIARLENVDVRTFRNLLIGKGILPERSLALGQGLMNEKVPYDLGVATAREMKRAVSAPVGMQLLNANRPLWNVLIERGRITAIADVGNHTTARCKAVDVRQIIRMLAHLEKLGTPVDEASFGFQTLSKCAEINRVPLTGIVTGLLAGHYEQVQRVSTEVGFKAIRFDITEVQRRESK